MLRTPDGDDRRPTGLILHGSYHRKARSPGYTRSLYRIPWNIPSFPSACFLCSTEANVMKLLLEVAKSEGASLGGFISLSHLQSKRPFKAFSFPPISLPLLLTTFFFSFPAFFLLSHLSFLNKQKKQGRGGHGVRG